MNKRAVAVLLIAGLAVSACGKPAHEAKVAADVGPMPDKNIGTALQRLPGTAANADSSAVTDAAVSIPQLAYDYDYSFAASKAGIESLIAADKAACDKAGVSACQMISLNANNNADLGYVSKTLELRVTPQWLKAWQSGLDGKLNAAGAHITSQNVTSEDLSLQIVDTEAHIKNKEALRDRLIAVIKSNPGKIADLVEAETQLSQVQEDIDSAQSAVAVMQKRVATSHLTLTYESEQGPASRGAFAPVAEAFRNILRNMMIMFGAIIQVLSFLVPLAIVIGPVAWIILKWQAKRKAARTALKPDETA